MDPERDRPAVHQRSVVPASVEEVWDRAVSSEGINHELGPFLRMTVPPAARGRSIGDVSPGDRLGRSWLLAFGVVPVELDDIGLAAVEPGRRFLEESTMLSMRRWCHERTLTPVPGGTAVEDRIWFEPRLLLRWVPGLRSAIRAGITALFRHRHRRLSAHYR